MLSKNTCEGVHLIKKLPAISLQASKFTKNELSKKIVIWCGEGGGVAPPHAPHYGKSCLAILPCLKNAKFINFDKLMIFFVQVKLLFEVQRTLLTPNNMEILCLSLDMYTLSLYITI